MLDLLRLSSIQPVLLLAILLGLGSLLGSVRYKGVHLGPAAVLFGAIAVSSLGTADGVKLGSGRSWEPSGSCCSRTPSAWCPGRTSSLRGGWTAMVAVVGVPLLRSLLGGWALGLTIAELELERRFGAVATRVRRGDRDLVSVVAVDLRAWPGAWCCAPTRGTPPACSAAPRPKILLAHLLAGL